MPRTRLGLATCVVLAILLLGGRAAWVASHLETDWTTLAIHWRDATVDWFFGKYEPVSNREPTDQADFWLRETERLVAANPQSAEIAMGAALLLDTPGPGFVSRYMKIVQFAPGMQYPELDYEAIDLALDQFHEKADRQCLALAARATQLEPENVRWWRLRALLHFPNDIMGSDRTPRNPAWSRVLNECARHDPDNAIYDYLAASHLWHESAEIDWEYDPPRLAIDDPRRFSQGVARFEGGLKKGCFTVERDTETRPVMAILAHSRLPCTELHEIIDSRAITLRRPFLLRELSRWQSARAHARVRAGDPAGALALLRQAVQLGEQYVASNELAAFDLITCAVRTADCAALRNFAEKHPNQLSEAEREQIKSQSLASRTDNKVLTNATQRVAAQRTGQRGFSSIAAMTVWGVTLSAAVLLFVVSGLAWIAARSLEKQKRQEQRRLGPWRHAIAWVVGFGLTFVVLGLAPAGVISHNAQAWIAGIGSVLAVIGLLASLAWFVCRRRLQFRLRTLFVVTLGVALLCAVLASLEVDFSNLKQLPEGLHVPARGWGPVDVKTWERSVTAQSGIGAWVVLQWWAYSGIYVSLAVSLLWVAVWQRVRVAKAESKGSGGWFAWKARWAATMEGTAESAAAMGACCLLVYLALTPTVLQSVDAVLEQQMAYARDPEAYWASLRQEVDRLKADSDYTKWVREEGEADLAREAELEAAAQEAGELEGEIEVDWLEADMEDVDEP